MKGGNFLSALRPLPTVPAPDLRFRESHCGNGLRLRGHPRPPPALEPEAESLWGPLRRLAGSAGGCRPRRGLRRLPLLCARPRAGAPRPPPRARSAPSLPRPAVRAPPVPGSRRPPASRAQPVESVGGQAASGPGRRASGWAVPASPLSLGGRAHLPGPTCARRPAALAGPGPAPPARAPGRSLFDSGRACGDPSGAEAANGGDRLAGVVVRRRQHVWCCVCRAVSPDAGRGGGGLLVSRRRVWTGAAGPVRLPGQPACPEPSLEPASVEELGMGILSTNPDTC
ncbi:PREDICTED: putative uncharacterized protein C1orf229 homolog [Hipposideros armiger]|uniref:Uncharacterized protein n=1 Tax=Hipposideros armiger TaxID=186990 RepID=A0A8B7RZV6_HIPAR|nr:PREDICTED: putative uncharacterized protein C1orf229 homolog [Hipposideros armiger]